MVKKAKLNPSLWLTNIIYLLQNGELSLRDVYEMSNTKENDLCESLLFEHPSIHFADGMVSFRPFAVVRNQAELKQLFKESHPMGLRRIDLRGLYSFVDADIDELLFRNELRMLDTRQDTLALTVHRAPLPKTFAQAFVDAVSNQT